MARIIAAKVLLLVDDEVLLLKNSQTHPRRAGQSDIPGGIIEANETTLDGLLREVTEETSIILDSKSLKLLYTSTNYLPSIFKSYIHNVYGVRLEKKPAVKLSWEHESYEWVPIANLVGLQKNYQHAVDYILDHQLLSEL